MTEEKTLSMEMNDIIHSQFHFEQYTAIIEVIQQNINNALSAIDFKLRIPKISNWEDLKVGQNLYYLKKIGVLDFDIVNDSPLKYKFTVHEGMLKVFKKWTDNTFILESDYTATDFFALIKKVEKEVFEEWYNKFLEYWSKTILDKYSKSERKKALIQQRDKEIDLYDSNENLVRFYDLTNLEQLAKDIHEAVTRKYKIPIDPNYPHTLLGGGIDALERALDLRFRCWYKIKSLNQLIDIESKATKPQKNGKSNTNIETIKRNIRITEDYIQFRKNGNEHKKARNETLNLWRKKNEKISEKTFRNILNENSNLLEKCGIEKWRSREVNS